MNAVIPSACPGSPDVRANTIACATSPAPLANRLAPLITQSPPSRTARVSSQVASLPCAGSVRLKPKPDSPAIARSMNSRFCSSLPNRSRISGNTRLPTIDASVWRSLCRPRPRAARWSRIAAIPRLVPSRPPIELGSA